MSIRTMYNAEADLYRPSATRTRGGGVTNTFALNYENFPCRISNVPPSERSVGDSMFSEASGVVYCPAEVAPLRGDEIRTSSVTYEVLGVRIPSKRNSHHEAIVRSEQRGGS